MLKLMNDPTEADSLLQVLYYCIIFVLQYKKSSMNYATVAYFSGYTFFRIKIRHQMLGSILPLISYQAQVVTSPQKVLEVLFLQKQH